MSKRKRWSIDEISIYIGNYGYTLLSTTYKTQKDKLNMICSKGHETSISLDNFKHGKRCNECHNENKSIMYRKSTEDVKKAYENIGYKVVNGLDSYKNQKSPLLVKCDKDHLYETYYQCLSVGSKCPECFGKKVDFEEIKNKFIEKDYTLLSEHYVSSNVKMEYICNKHNHEIQYVTWDNIKQDRACRFCGIEKVADAKRLNIEEVQNIFLSKGYKLLETDYMNNTTKMKFICSKHNHEIQETDLNSVMFNKNSCSFCINENTSGRNSHLWRNGNSDINDFLRKSLKEWKLDSMKESNYKCIVTGEKFDVIHHLYSFNNIVDETFNELGLTEFKKINEYTDDELLLIRNKCLEIHYRYPLGVCLSKKVHDEFHLIYGKGNNTPEQFYEFVG